VCVCVGEVCCVLTGAVDDVCVGEVCCVLTEAVDGVCMCVCVCVFYLLKTVIKYC